jgi:hypothetical protein
VMQNSDLLAYYAVQPAPPDQACPRRALRSVACCSARASARRTRGVKAKAEREQAGWEESFPARSWPSAHRQSY